MVPTNAAHSGLSANSADGAWNLPVSLLLLLLLAAVVVVVVAAVVLSLKSTHFVECRATKKMKYSPF